MEQYDASSVLKMVIYRVATGVAAVGKKNPVPHHRIVVVMVGTRERMQRVRNICFISIDSLLMD